MGNIIPINDRHQRFKNIDFSNIPVLHQQLLFQNGFVLDFLNQIKISNLITIKDTCN
jgi:hypothetical protein